MSTTTPSIQSTPSMMTRGPESAFDSDTSGETSNAPTLGNAITPRQADLSEEISDVSHLHGPKPITSEDTPMMRPGSDTCDKGLVSLFRRRLQSAWLWEICGVVISVSCMVAIVIILPLLDDHPLENWRFAIAPNTLISTFITVSKTSMLLAVAAGMSQLKWQHFHETPRPLHELDVFEEAARGPWGALSFLFRIRIRMRLNTVIATVGALVILSSLTMEPLAQQIISFRTRYDSQKDGDRPWIAIATSYDHSGDSDISPIIDFQNPIVTALVNSPPPPSYSCSTGNCSWPDFATLGVCNTCLNVTSTTSLEKIYTHPFNLSERVQRLYTTPGGVLLNASEPWSDSGAWFIGDFILGNIKHKEQRSSIAVLAVANTSRVLDGDDGKRFVYNANADIIECSLRWCAKVFQNVSVMNGTMSDYAVHEVEEVKEVPIPSSDYNNYLIMTVDAAPQTNKSINFTVSTDGYYGLQEILGTYFTFNLNQNFDDDQYPFKTGLSLLTRGNTTAAIAAVADALTLQIMSGLDSTRHEGSAFSSQIYVKVRWGWFIFPALLSILGAGFLVASIIVGRRHRATLGWKAGLMPLLFHGMSGWDGEGLNGVERREEMDALAKGIKSRLAWDEAGDLKFMKVKID